MDVRYADFKKGKIMKTKTPRRMTMNNRNNLFAVSALLLVAALALPTGNAAAQDATSVAGTYTPVLATSFGDNPRGQLILGSDGHYSLNLARATLPKIATGARGKGT